ASPAPRTGHGVRPRGRRPPALACVVRTQTLVVLQQIQGGAARQTRFESSARRPRWRLARWGYERAIEPIDPMVIGWTPARLRPTAGGRELEPRRGNRRDRQR